MYASARFFASARRAASRPVITSALSTAPRRPRRASSSVLAAVHPSRANAGV
jgi:hypothetical protein